MCIARGARLQKRHTHVILNGGDADFAWFTSSPKSKSSVSTTSEFMPLKRNDTETTVSLSSTGTEYSDDDISLSKDGNNLKSNSHLSNHAASCTDDYYPQPSKEDPIKEPSPKSTIGETNMLQEKRKRLTCLRKNIFQRLDSMNSILQEDAPTSECVNHETRSTCTSSSTLLSASRADDTPFESQFEPHEMRCLALVAHGHMKPALLDYVQSNRELLKKFRLTGPKDTVDMLRSIYGKDDKPPIIVPCPRTPGYSYEAQLAVQICMHDIGGIVFFMDPFAQQQQQQQDVNAILTMANRHNVLLMTNPMTATAMSNMIRVALMEGRQELATCFFENSPSPAIQEYKKRHLANTTELKDNAVVESMLDATLLMNILSPSIV